MVNQKDNKNKNPLVSICATFFNSGRYIHRALDSCLNQTYKNIEVVIVDDASTDNSEKVLREYAGRDSRIKYFRNDKRIGLAESELQMFKLAKGDFSMMLGADDWLARHYIENGVATFLKHPDAAGVVPDLTTLFEYGDNDVFTFGGRQHFSPGTRSAGWFIRRMYRPMHLFVSGFALVRSKDLVSALDYYVKNYYHSPSKSLPEELRGFFRRAFGMDAMTFPEILTRYKNFVFDGSLNYIKISHSSNQPFDLKEDSLSEISKKFYYYLLIYKYIYKFKWPRFYPGMKIFVGAQTLSLVFINFFRYGLRPSFLNFSESKKYIRGFFSEFSIFEIVTVVMYSVPRVVSRCFDFAIRKFIKKDEQKIGEFPVFTQENFLDSERRFKVD